MSNINMDAVFGTAASVGGVIQDTANSFQYRFGNPSQPNMGDSRRNYGWSQQPGYDPYGSGAFMNMGNGGMNMGSMGISGYPGFADAGYGGVMR